jgi:hypothetical protein
VRVARVALSYCNVESRVLRGIQCLCNEVLGAAAIERCLDGIYGEASPSYSTVKDWAKPAFLKLWPADHKWSSGSALVVLLD